MTKSFLVLISVTILVFSCSKENEVVVPDTSYEYAGLALGKYVVYNVDSITYNDFDGSIDTAKYQIREVVDAKFTDLEGDEAFKIIRYKRYSDTLSWNLIDVWSSKLTPLNFQKTEENLKLIKLIFPVKVGRVWNGNVMNNNENQEYEYTSADNQENIGGISLQNVLKVKQFEALDNLINPQQFEEKFAKGVGLVYKRSMNRSRSNLSAPWRGYDVTMTLASFGG